jgi:hypothetical protein
LSAVENARFALYDGQMQLSRRHLLLTTTAMLGSACAQGAKVYDMKVSRDDGCTCCSAWADIMQQTGRFKVTMFDAGDAPTFKRSVGVPVGMGACHTAMIGDYVFEGHVPPEDILRFMEEKPEGVLGLVVPGMPRGSAGMEQPNGAKDAFIVYAFKAGGTTSEYASHSGNS